MLSLKAYFARLISCSFACQRHSLMGNHFLGFTRKVRVSWWTKQGKGTVAGRFPNPLWECLRLNKYTQEPRWKWSRHKKSVQQIIEASCYMVAAYGPSLNISHPCSSTLLSFYYIKCFHHTFSRLHYNSLRKHTKNAILYHCTSSWWQKQSNAPWSFNYCFHGDSLKIIQVL